MDQRQARRRPHRSCTRRATPSYWSERTYLAGWGDQETKLWHRPGRMGELGALFGRNLLDHSTGLS